MDLIISFRHTPLFKRGMWLSAASLMVFVATPGLLNGGFQRDPITHVIPLCIFGGVLFYFLRRMQLHRLADEVIDCEDHLMVRRGDTEEKIPFTSISMADVSTSSGIHRITVHLSQPIKWGGRIEFLPQASLWSNRLGIERVASNLTDRANQAKSGRAGGDSRGNQS